MRPVYIPHPRPFIKKAGFNSSATRHSSALSDSLKPSRARKIKSAQIKRAAHLHAARICIRASERRRSSAAPAKTRGREKGRGLATSSRFPPFRRPSVSVAAGLISRRRVSADRLKVRSLDPSPRPREKGKPHQSCASCAGRPCLAESGPRPRLSLSLSATPAVGRKMRPRTYAAEID